MAILAAQVLHRLSAIPLYYKHFSLINVDMAIYTIDISL